MPVDARAIVVGAGPAGASAACGLARAGFQVVLFEQQRVWQGRVCGGFINPEGVGHLAWLGVLDALRAAGAVDVPMTRLTLAAGGSSRFDARSKDGRRADPGPGHAPAIREAMVPITRTGVGGLGVTREILEAVLRQAACRAGVFVRDGARVTDVRKDGSRWRVSARVAGSGAEDDVADLVVLADGRFSGGTPGRRTPGGRPAESSEQQARAGGWYGWNASFAGVLAAPGELSMHFYPGGYVGLLTFADGKTNVCGLIERMPPEGRSWDEVWNDALARQPALGELVGRARRVSPWRGVGPLPFGRRRWASGMPILAGDAGGVGDPYMGEGISRALGTGPLLHEAFLAAGRSHRPAAVEAMAHRYAAGWRRSYARRFRLGSLVRRLQEHPALFETALAPLLRRPGALHRLSGVFHAA